MKKTKFHNASFYGTPLTQSINNPSKKDFPVYNPVGASSSDLIHAIRQGDIKLAKSLAKNRKIIASVLSHPKEISNFINLDFFWEAVFNDSKNMEIFEEKANEREEIFQVSLIALKKLKFYYPLDKFDSNTMDRLINNIFIPNFKKIMGHPLLNEQLNDYAELDKKVVNELFIIMEKLSSSTSLDQIFIHIQETIETDNSEKIRVLFMALIMQLKQDFSFGFCLFHTYNLSTNPMRHTHINLFKSLTNKDKFFPYFFYLTIKTIIIHTRENKLFIDDPRLEIERIIYEYPDLFNEAFKFFNFEEIVQFLNFYNKDEEIKIFSVLPIETVFEIVKYAKKSEKILEAISIILRKDLIEEEHGDDILSQESLKKLKPILTLFNINFLDQLLHDIRKELSLKEDSSDLIKLINSEIISKQAKRKRSPSLETLSSTRIFQSPNKRPCQRKEEFHEKQQFSTHFAKRLNSFCRHWRGK